MTRKHQDDQMVRCIVIPPYTGAQTHAYEHTTTYKDMHKLGDLIGGAAGSCMLEQVKLPETGRTDFVAVVDEEGMLKNLPINYTGSIMYGTHRHGQRLYGTVVLIGHEWSPEGSDWCTLPQDITVDWLSTYITKNFLDTVDNAIATLQSMASYEQRRYNRP